MGLWEGLGSGASASARGKRPWWGPTESWEMEARGRGLFLFVLNVCLKSRPRQTPAICCSHLRCPGQARAEPRAPSQPPTWLTGSRSPLPPRLGMHRKQSWDLNPSPLLWDVGVQVSSSRPHRTLQGQALGLRLWEAPGRPFPRGDWGTCTLLVGAGLMEPHRLGMPGLPDGAGRQRRQLSPPTQFFDVSFGSSPRGA